jgi:hypothetical protein
MVLMASCCRAGFVPTIKDLERFLLAYPDVLNGLGNGIYCHSSFMKGLHHILHVLAFDHAFKLTHQDALHIKAIFDKHLKGETLINDVKRTSKWASSQLIREMCFERIVGALSKGTKSFDVVFHDMLSLALHSTLASRAGDIAQSAHYEIGKFTKYSDVSIYLNEDSTFRGDIVLRYTKGHK